MLVRVSKPRNGRTNVHVDDRKGSTGFSVRTKNVPVGEVGELVVSLAAQWESRRQLIKEARRGRRP